MLQCNISHFFSRFDENNFDYIQDIPSMQRRRLSHLAKNALNTARLILEKVGTVDYIVWSSKYGDEAKTFGILDDIANDELISPTSFSTSVHNAIAGLYSIYFNDHTPSTSISSATHHVWQDAIAEAYAYLQANQKNSALVVYYDEPLLGVYENDAKMTKSIVAGAIISRGHDNIQLQLKSDEHIDDDDLLQFIKFWLGNDQICQMRHTLWQKI